MYDQSKDWYRTRARHRMANYGLAALCVAVAAVVKLTDGLVWLAYALGVIPALAPSLVYIALAVSFDFASISFQKSSKDIKIDRTSFDMINRHSQRRI